MTVVAIWGVFAATKGDDRARAREVRVAESSGLLVGRFGSCCAGAVPLRQLPTTEATRSSSTGCLSRLARAVAREVHPKASDAPSCSRSPTTGGLSDDGPHVRTHDTRAFLALMAIAQRQRSSPHSDRRGVDRVSS